MGAALGLFRKSKSSVEILEGINKEIEKRNKFHLRNQELQRKFVARLIIYSVLAYVAGALLLFVFYFPTLPWKYRALCFIPLIVFPMLMWLLKRLLHWYFVKRITDNDSLLHELKNKKKSILDDVMETETYKKAKEILEKFDPEQFKKLEKVDEAKVLEPMTPHHSQTGSDVRRRQVGLTPLASQQMSRFSIPGPTPHVGIALADQSRIQDSGVTPMVMYSPGSSSFIGAPGSGMIPGRMLPLPRVVPPRDRSAVDRLVEYLVGDGPNQRYALICGRCFSHNGMAMKEEYEYLSFRCCYCYNFNPAKKQRPNAPPLEEDSQESVQLIDDSTAADTLQGDDDEVDAADLTLPENEGEEKEGSPDPSGTNTGSQHST